MDATHKQKRYIQILSARLGKEVPLHHLFGKTKMEASLTIDRLKRQLTRSTRKQHGTREHAKKEEVRRAVQHAASPTPKVRVVSKQPQVRYTYTCPLCGCHNYARITVNDAWEPHTIKVCAWCGGQARDSVEWFSKLRKRQQRREGNNK